jgi:hypothetical protein
MEYGTLAGRITSCVSRDTERREYEGQHWTKITDSRSPSGCGQMRLVMCRVGPQTHGPLKPGPFGLSSARLKDGPGVSLSRAWEFKKPRLRAWPEPGHLFSFLPNLDMYALPHVM